jgi:hypothetical protein
MNWLIHIRPAAARRQATLRWFSTARMAAAIWPPWRLARQNAALARQIRLSDNLGPVENPQPPP